MGSPEFPGDENDRQNQFEPPPSHALPMHGIVSSEDDADSTDDATQPDDGGFQDIDQQNTFDPSQPYAAEGYHPLNFQIHTTDDNSESDNDDDSSSANSIADIAEDRNDEEESVEPEIETTAEREILSEIWNAPRPVESADIALDNDKAEQVFIRLRCAHKL